jgi:hypothetical protein
MANGRVTIVAKDATPRQILEEWARVGQTRLVNAERLTAPPTSIDLENVPEAQALDTLLRSASGYVAAPRASEVPNASQFDRIFILATSSPARPATSVAATPAPAPFQPPVFPPGADSPADDQQNRPPVQPGAVAPRAPVFTTFPQPPQVPPVNAPVQGGYPPNAVPTAPAATGTTTPGAGPAVGSAIPGMPVPVPQQPGQPGQPVQPGQPQLLPGQR